MNPKSEIDEFTAEVIKPHEQYVKSKDLLESSTKGLDKEHIRRAVFEASYMAGFIAGMLYATEDDE